MIAFCSRTSRGFAAVPCGALRTFAAIFAAGVCAATPIFAGPVNLSAKRVQVSVNDIQTASINRSISGNAIEFHLSNPTTSELSKLSLAYKIFVRNRTPGTKPQETPLEVVTGKIAIPSIHANQRLTLLSTTFFLDRNQLKSGWVYANGSAVRNQDVFVGVAAVLSDASGSRVADMATSRALLDGWDTPQVPVRLRASPHSPRSLIAAQTVEPASLGSGGSDGEEEEGAAAP